MTIAVIIITIFFVIAISQPVEIAMQLNNATNIEIAGIKFRGASGSLYIKSPAYLVMKFTQDTVVVDITKNVEQKII